MRCKYATTWRHNARREMTNGPPSVQLQSTATARRLETQENVYRAPIPTGNAWRGGRVRVRYLDRAGAAGNTASSHTETKYGQTPVVVADTAQAYGEH